MMQRLMIPGTPVAISRIGLGCARLFGGRELKTSARLIDAALRAGITHFDTAPAYGSEDVLGAVLAGARGVTIATKIGLPRAIPPAALPRRFFGSVYRRSLRPVLARMPAVKARLLRAATRSARPASTGPPRRLTREEVLRELAESQRRLKRPSIDLYLLHEPDGLEITDELRELFASLQAEDVIGGYGLAFGGARNPSVHFGTAAQCRYVAETAGETHAGVARLYHGVLRHGLRVGPPIRGSGGAPEFVRRVLAADAGCAVVFSASTARQIAHIAQDGSGL
jgi:D-threo-aldose 1-dehydrogenase